MVTKLVEVLPMVMDMLTISSFVALILYKVVVAISPMFGGRIHIIVPSYAYGAPKPSTIQFQNSSCPS